MRATVAAGSPAGPSATAGELGSSGLAGPSATAGELESSGLAGCLLLALSTSLPDPVQHMLLQAMERLLVCGCSARMLVLLPSNGSSSGSPGLLPLLAAMTMVHGDEASSNNDASSGNINVVAEGLPPDVEVSLPQMAGQLLKQLVATVTSGAVATEVATVTSGAVAGLGEKQKQRQQQPGVACLQGR